MFDKEKKDVTVNFKVTRNQKDTIEFMCAHNSEKQTDLILRLLNSEYQKIMSDLEVK